MKKFVKMMMVAAIAMTATVACSSDDKNEPEPPTPGATTIKVTAPANLDKAGELQFTIAPKSDKDVVITIANSNDKALTVAKTVTIKANSVGAKTSITPIADGEAVLTYTSAGVTFTPATSTIKTKAPVIPGVKYCEPEMEFAYACLEGVTISGTDFATADPEMRGGDYSDLTATPVKIKNGDEFTIKYSNNNSGANDDYNVYIFADWNKDGAFVKVFEKAIKAGENNAKQNITGTLTVPADAKASRIRVLSTFIGDTGVPSTDGCQRVESGSIIDIAYTL